MNRTRESEATATNLRQRHRPEAKLDPIDIITTRNVVGRNRLLLWVIFDRCRFLTADLLQVRFKTGSRQFSLRKIRRCLVGRRCPLV